MGDRIFGVMLLRFKRVCRFTGCSGSVRPHRFSLSLIVSGREADKSQQGGPEQKVGVLIHTVSGLLSNYDNEGLNWSN